MGRFSNLDKIPDAPALRLLALANVRLNRPTGLPAAAPVGDVLEALDGQDDHVGMFKLLAVSLPPREGVWWACLAARDLVQDDDPPPLAAAEAWVRRPCEETGIAARHAFETADFDDDTVLCAQAAATADGRLGPGDLSGYEAPVGTCAMSIFGTVIMSYANAPPGEGAARAELLLARALDIAKGGSGRVTPATREDNAAASTAET